MNAKKRQTRTGLSKTADVKSFRARVAENISDRWYAIPFPKWTPTAVAYTISITVLVGSVIMLAQLVRVIVFVSGFNWLVALIVYAFVTGMGIRFARDARRIATAGVSRYDAMIRRTRALFVPADKEVDDDD